MTTIKVDDEITLRSPTVDDAAPLFALIDANREFLSRWLPWSDNMRTVEDERRWVEDRIAAGTSDTLAMLIEYRGALVGSIGLHHLASPERAAEIGYWLAEQLQGRGIVTRACRRLLDYAFGERAMNRVRIRAAPGNTRSRAIPERLGFTLEGAPLPVETVRDEQLAVYSILASQWQQTRGRR